MLFLFSLALTHYNKLGSFVVVVAECLLLYLLKTFKTIFFLLQSKNVFLIFFFFLKFNSEIKNRLVD